MPLFNRDPRVNQQSMKNPAIKACILLLAAWSWSGVPEASFGADGPVTITSQPASQTIFVGDPVTFTVSVDGTAPFTYQWLRGGAPISLATASSYTIASTTTGDNEALYSVIISNSFGAVTSETAILTIDVGVLTTNTFALVPFNATWRYNQTGSDLGTAWKAVGYNDAVAGWLSGAGILANENCGCLPVPINTTLTLGGLTTYYFRMHFAFTNTGVISLRLRATLLNDDGAAVYLNGQEVIRVGLIQGALASDWANRTIGDAAYEYFDDLPTNYLVAGDNVIAAEAHNINATSTDITFGLLLEADVVTRVRDTVAPTVVRTAPANNTAVRSLDRITVYFSEAVTGVDAADLLINNVAATSLDFFGPDICQFIFTQPANGVVQVTWAQGHGIRDLAASPNSFVPQNFTYTLDPNASLSTVRINEILASNKTGKRDEDGDYSDWIELYNYGPTALSLGGWFLSDDPFRLDAWRFPDVTIAANGYLLVWASEKNRTNAVAPLHTNFRLNKQSGYLGLTMPDGTNIVSQISPTYPPQADDVSYGADRNDPSLLVYFSTPTPLAANDLSSSAGLAPEVIFSRLGGTFLSPFSLELSVGYTNATIRYTLGNTNVTTNSTLYTGPITIRTNMHVRARAFQPGRLPGPPSSQSYLLLAPAATNWSSDLPVVILHTFGNSSISAGAGAADTFANCTIIDTNSVGRTYLTNRPSVSTRAGINLRGSSTQGLAKRNLAVEFWDEASIDVEREVLGMPAESDWVLYPPNGFDHPLIHNPFIYEVSRQVGRYASRTRFVELFYKAESTTTGPINTNADYFGLYVLTEKIKIDNNRVDIPNLEDENTNAPSVTGGYLFLINSGRVDANERAINVSPTGQQVIYQDPEGPLIQDSAQRQPQETYIVNYLNTFASALSGASFTNPITGYAAYIDVDSWIDHHIINILGRNVDAIRLSGYFYKDREKKIEFGPIWDFDRAMGTGKPSETDITYRSYNPREWLNQASGDRGTDFFRYATHQWWGRLFEDIDFWQRYIDRWQALRRTHFTTNSLFAIVDRMAVEISEAQRRDQVKWSSQSGAGNTSPRSGTITANGYTNTFDGTYAGEIVFLKRWLADRMNFIDTNFLAAPGLSRAEGQVASGTQVILTDLSGKAGTTIYYTLDGTDPRLPAGAISPAALVYSGPITIMSNVRVFARALNPNHRNVLNANCPYGGCPPLSTPWSGPAVATYFINTPPLRITEIMYDPSAMPGDTNDPGNFEFIELANVSGGTLSLVGFQFTNGLEFKFTATNSVTSLAAGGRVLVVKNRAAFLSRYPTLAAQVAGEFTGSLDNAGERVTLIGPLCEPILDFRYDNQWQPATDGLGFSLVPINESAPTSSWTNAASWRASAYNGGSPATADPTPASILPVVVNEIVPLGLPVSGYPDGVDAVELFNPNATPVDVGLWYLTDNRNQPQKYRISPDTFIPANGYRILYATNSFGMSGVTNVYGDTNGFGFSSSGEAVYLFSGDSAGRLTGYFQGFDFGPAALGVSFGRYTNSVDHAMEVAQSAVTLGAPNAYPLVGPLVINEIMFYPPDLFANGVLSDNFRDEFIELRNISDQEVLLYDTSFPVNRWQIEQAVDFTFPVGASVLPHGYVLVVSFDPVLEPVSVAAFRARYGLSDSVPIYGPFGGQLANEGERLELRKPGIVNPNTGLAPMVLVDRVDYTPTNPWPATASGTGASLQRRVASEFGNDPINWLGAAPSAGGEPVSGTPPTITAQPQPLTVPEESTATFTVSADGTGPFFYQWFLDGIPLDGAYSASLVLTNVQLSQAGGYSVLVLTGSGSALSSVAGLTVRPIPVILQHPASTNITLGTTIVNLTLRVSAMGTGELSYQWQYQSYTDLDYSNLPGATASTLTLDNIQPEDSGRYRVLVTDSIGTRASLPAVINVSIKPAITQQPSPVNQIVAVGETATIHVEVSGTRPLGCRWRKNGQPYVPVGTETLTFTNAVLTDGAFYDVVVTNLAGAAPLSAKAYLVVVAPPTNQAVLPGSDVTLRAIVGSSGSFTNWFWWRFNDTSLLREGTNGVATTTPTLFTDDLVLTNLQAGQVGNYTFLVSNVVTVTTNVYAVTRSFTARVVFADTNPPVTLAIEWQGTNAVIRWADSPATWTLEETTDLTPPPNWQPSGATPVLGAGRWEATVPVAEGTNKFFRLKRP